MCECINLCFCEYQVPPLQGMPHEYPARFSDHHPRHDRVKSAPFEQPSGPAPPVCSNPVFLFFYIWSGVHGRLRMFMYGYLRKVCFRCYTHRKKVVLQKNC